MTGTSRRYSWASSSWARRPRRARLPSLLLVPALAFAQARVITVAADGSGDYRTVQAALDAAPSGNALIRIRPGTYYEPHIQLRGTGTSPSQVVLSYDRSAGTAGGTFKSASVLVTGDDFYADNLTVENTFSRHRPLTQEGSQAVALRVTGDRAVFRRVRFLGYQD